MVAAANVERVAYNVGTALNSLIKDLSPAEQAAFQGLAQQLQRVSNQGSGDQYYWMERTQQVVDETRRLATAVRTIADQL